MTPTKIHELGQYGQSLWLDYISRSMIKNGKLRKMIDIGILGMTSNPTIFNQAISKGNDYDELISKMKEKGKTTFEIYDELTLNDVADAADLFRAVYEETGGDDGYVSLEINPHLANDAEASIREGLRLFGRLKRPNVMIKVPVTEAGPEIIEELIAQGINVNATLIFSPEQYWKTAWAYFKGLERYTEIDQDLSLVHSVASVFVSRIDTTVDKLIDQKLTQEEAQDSMLLQRLKGRAAVANAEIVFDKFKQMFSSGQYRTLAKKGARVQRVLWASTGTKNPNYSDIKYISELICKPSVNTVPEKTLEAFLDHGKVKESLPADEGRANETFEFLGKAGINIDAVCDELLKAGLHAFCLSFDELLQSIEAKATMMCSSS